MKLSGLSSMCESGFVNYFSFPFNIFSIFLTYNQRISDVMDEYIELSFFLF